MPPTRPPACPLLAGTYTFKKDGTFSFTDKSTGKVTTGTGSISPSGTLTIKSTDGATTTPTTTPTASTPTATGNKTSTGNSAAGARRGAGLAATLAAVALLAL
jgi:hypothetical protein